MLNRREETEVSTERTQFNGDYPRLIIISASVKLLNIYLAEMSIFFWPKRLSFWPNRPCFWPKRPCFFWPKRIMAETSCNQLSDKQGKHNSSSPGKVVLSLSCSCI